MMLRTSLAMRPGAALDHAVGLGRAGPDVAVLRAKAGAGFGERRAEAAAVVGQHVGQAEGERRAGLAQGGDGAVLGFVVLDGEMDGARAAVDGDEQAALAPLAVAGLQLGRSQPRFRQRGRWKAGGGRCVAPITLRRRCTRMSMIPDPPD